MPMNFPTHTSGMAARSGDPEKLGLVWRRNVAMHSGNLHLNDGEGYGRPQKPPESSLSDEAFAHVVRDRNLIGIYGPPEAS